MLMFDFGRGSGVCSRDSLIKKIFLKLVDSIYNRKLTDTLSEINLIFPHNSH